MYCTKRTTFSLVIFLILFGSSLQSMECTSIEESLSQKSKLKAERTTVRYEDNSLVFYKSILAGLSKECCKKEIGRISDVHYLKNFYLFLHLEPNLLRDVKQYIAHLLARLVLGKTLDCNFELYKTLKGPSCKFVPAEFSLDGKTIIAGGALSEMNLWDVEKGKVLLQLIDNANRVSAFVLSPDGKTVLVGHKDGTVCLWCAETAVPIKTFKGHGKPVTAVAFSPDMKILFTGSMDHTARLWNVADGGELAQLQHTSLVGGVAFSQDGKWLLTAASHAVYLWNLSNRELIRQF